MQRGWFVLLGLLAVAASGQAATVNVEVGRDDPNDPAVAFLRYYPETVVVWVNDTVTWDAKSHAPHTVTGAGFDSTPQLRLDDPAIGAWFGPGGFLMPGQSFNHTFDRPGTFAYFCKIHPAMAGTIRVQNATSTSTPTGGSGLPLPGGSGGANRTGPGETVYVTAGWGGAQDTHDSFGPADITIATGTTVVWTNLATTEPHTVTSMPGNFDSSPKVTGEPPWWNGPGGMMSVTGANRQFSHTFDAAGHFLYLCKIHPGMVGTVVVLERPNAADAGQDARGPTTTTDAGSRVPGLEAPLLALGILGAALAARRRG